LRSPRALCAAALVLLLNPATARAQGPGAPEPDAEISAEPAPEPRDDSAGKHVAPPALDQGPPAPARGRPVPLPLPPPLPPTPTPQAAGQLPGYRVSGYLQTQLESHQDSEDQVRQGGLLLNQNRFLLRRGRLRVERTWEHAEMILELDANTINGPTVAARTAEASLFYRGSQAAADPPLIKATMGIFNVPLGRELTEGPKKRHFVERTFASRAFFTGEPDVGLRLSGGIDFFRYAVAAVNGEPIDERSGFALRDPNGSKDLVARFGLDAPLSDAVRVAGGASMLRGKGFHPGTPAGKNQLVWRDLNEDGLPQQNEISSAPGLAALPSENFDRWAVGVDAELSVTSSLGVTHVFGEIVAASNLDRGLFVADPVIASQDIRELGYHVGLVQEIAPYALLGLRFETYDPNADFLDKRQGKLLPSTQRIEVFSPMVGLQLPGRAKLIYQVDFIRDFLARDRLGVPIDMRNDQSTLRLQVEL
jgi:hypothetical protein